MQAELQGSKQFKHALEWWLLASLLIHALLLLFIPKPTYENRPAKKQEIHIELVKQEAPAAKPEPAPDKPQAVEPPPRPVAPKPVVTKPAEPKPTPQKVAPMPETPREPTPPAPEVTSQPVITASPAPNASKSELVVPPPPAPPPEPPKVTGPSEGDIDAARNAFRSAAHRELKKHQRYPRIAQDRGIEGEVKLSINLDDQGNITGIEIMESSGNRALDDAATTAAQKSQLKPYFHEILRGKINNIVVTVSFKLAS
ncbi:outer membrane transport energization protein TonB [Methylophilus rhizosphaerae]|uniref:Outer membrane transport energization protein TonB n=1 Tax=Methylophilus rhizosphaerae TaxID=492660 RepID=A0A1G9CU70_9PROT|nr:TonB family protein [Methylophilus rhizosphaerae]SDK55169.1 outer membrane transport energization protein TonB [Methylophilus rhizosphaerae]